MKTGDVLYVNPKAGSRFITADEEAFGEGLDADDIGVVLVGLEGVGMVPVKLIVLEVIHLTSLGATDQSVAFKPAMLRKDGLMVG